MSAITINEHPIGKIYLNGRRYSGGTNVEVNLTDVCNHGKYVGSVNPMYDSLLYTSASSNPNYSKFYFDEQGRLFRGNSGWDYSRATIVTAIDKKAFSRVCCHAVITNRTSTSYSNYDFTFGVFKKSRGYTYDGFDKYITIGSRNGNYAGTTPVYIMPETFIELDVSDLSEDFYYIRVTSCDLQCYLTDIWVEP